MSQAAPYCFTATQRADPSFKGTFCAKAQAAPYVER